MYEVETREKVIRVSKLGKGRVVSNKYVVTPERTWYMGDCTHKNINDYVGVFYLRGENQRLAHTLAYVPTDYQGEATERIVGLEIVEKEDKLYAKVITRRRESYIELKEPWNFEQYTEVAYHKGKCPSLVHRQKPEEGFIYTVDTKQAFEAITAWKEKKEAVLRVEREKKKAEINKKVQEAEEKYKAERLKLRLEAKNKEKEWQKKEKARQKKEREAEKEAKRKADYRRKKNKEKAEAKAYARAQKKKGEEKMRKEENKVETEQTRRKKQQRLRSFLLGRYQGEGVAQVPSVARIQKETRHLGIYDVAESIQNLPIIARLQEAQKDEQLVYAMLEVTSLPNLKLKLDCLSYYDVLLAYKNFKIFYAKNKKLLQELVKCFKEKRAEEEEVLYQLYTELKKGENKAYTGASRVYMGANREGFFLKSDAQGQKECNAFLFDVQQQGGIVFISYEVGKEC